MSKLKLPPITEVQVYSVDKIVNSRSKISTVEKIDLLLKLEAALKDKLEDIKKKRGVKTPAATTEEKKVSPESEQRMESSIQEGQEV